MDHFWIFFSGKRLRCSAWCSISMRMSNNRQRKLFDAIAQTLNRIALVSAKLNSHIARSTCSPLSVSFFRKSDSVVLRGARCKHESAFSLRESSHFHRSLPFALLLGCARGVLESSHFIVHCPWPGSWAVLRGSCYFQFYSIKS